MRNVNTIMWIVGSIYKQLVMVQQSTLGGFILEEMRKRDMSARDFALYVGVSHSAINKFLNYGIEDTYAGKPIGEPSIDFLYRLARRQVLPLARLRH